MATVKRASGRKRRQYIVQCKGLRKQKLFQVYRTFNEDPRCHYCAFVNPFPPHFDSQAIHCMVLALSGDAAYAGKKGIDIVAEILKSRWTDRNSLENEIVIFGPRGETIKGIKAKGQSPRR